MNKYIEMERSEQAIQLSPKNRILVKANKRVKQKKNHVAESAWPLSIERMNKKLSPVLSNKDLPVTYKKEEISDSFERRVYS